MSGLPFLKIPLLAQLEILKYVEVNNLINLSFCSERTRPIVETASAQLERLDIRYGNGYSWFCCNDGHIIECSSDPFVAGGRVKAYYSKNNREGGQVVMFRSEQPMDSLRELLTSHLMRTFRNVKRVDVDYYDIGVLTIPLWKYTRSLGRFRCSTKTMVLKEEEIEFILNELSIYDTLMIDPPVVDGFFYSKGFAPRTVDIQHANWVQFDAILNSASCSIFLSQIERPPAALLNNFLKVWMSKEKMENLKEFELLFKTQEDFSEAYLLEVRDGIVHQIDPFYRHVKIQRIDGKSATLKFSRLRFIFSTDQ